MIRPHNIWRSLAPRPRKKNINSRAGQRKRNQLLLMLKLLKEDHPHIYAGHLNASLSKVEAEFFCEKLRVNSAGHLYKQRRNLFVLGLERGMEQLNWDVFIPAPISTSWRSPPYFTRASMLELSKLRHIEQAVLDSLEHSIPENTSVALGYLIFSASVYGGLLNRDWLIAWARDPFDNLIYEEPIAWVELYRNLMDKKKPVDDSVKKLHLRWFVDPMTLLLLSHLQGQIQTAKYKRIDPWQYIRSLLDYLNIPQNERPKNLTIFLNMAHTKTGLSSQTYLADYGAGKVKSISLSPEVWARVRTGRPVVIPNNIPDIGTEYPPLVQKKPKFSSHSSNKNGELRRKLYNAIFPIESRQKKKRTSSGKSKKNIQQFLEIYGGKLNQITWLLAQWAINLLTYTRGRRNGSKIAASSVHSYVTTIASPLHIHANNDDLIIYSEIEFYSLYQDIIDQKLSTSNKQTTALRLVSFHEFLVKYWDVSPVDLSEFYRGKNNSDIGVVANIICPTMYKGILNALGGLTLNQPREQLMLVLMTILGQKCGLRRGEIITLLCSDILGRYNPVLFVRHNPYAYKKSDSAIRKIPLKAFLTHKELSLLISWLHQRNRESHSISNTTQLDKNNLLFCKAGESKTPIDEAGAFDAIHQAMKQVSGDPSMHFHLFRHSFASWFLFRMESGSDSVWHPKSILALNTSENSVRQRRVECKRLFQEQQVSTKHLYELAEKCGHSSSQMSLRHYVHILDLLLGLSCWKREVQPSLSLEAVKSLTGLAQAMAYRYKSRSKQDQYLPSIFVPRAFMQLKHQHKDKLVEKLKPINESLVAIKKKPIAWSTIQNIIEELQIDKIKVNAISQKYSIKSSLIEEWIERVRYIHNMRTRSTSKHLEGKRRHRPESARLPFPTRPISSYDIMMVDRIVNYFRSSTTKKEEILTGANCFLEHYSVSSGDIRFRDKKTAKKYLNFLFLIGIKIEEIRLIHYRGKGIQDKDAKVHASNWASILSIPFENCDWENSRYGQKKGNGTIGITISSVTGLTGKGRKNKKPKFSMPYGFRYALYMLYIISSET